MQHWSWFIVLTVMSCRGRRDASLSGEEICPPVDAIIHPLVDDRAMVQQMYPVKSPEQWTERATVDAEAAVQLRQAELPDEISDAAIAAYIASLEEMNATATRLASLYNELVDSDRAQDELKERIDAAAAALKAHCGDYDKFPEGCEWTQDPGEPEGTDTAALKAYVAAGRDIHVSDAEAETLWQSILDALGERADAIIAEQTCLEQIETVHAEFDALVAAEVPLLKALKADCPPMAPVLVDDTPVDGTPGNGIPGNGPPGNGIPGNGPHPPPDGPADPSTHPPDSAAMPPGTAPSTPSGPPDPNLPADPNAIGPGPGAPDGQPNPDIPPSPNVVVDPNAPLPDQEAPEASPSDGDVP